MGPFVWTVQKQILCWWERGGNIAATRFVQEDTVAAFRKNRKSKSCKVMINLPYQHSACFRLEAENAMEVACDVGVAPY